MAAMIGEMSDLMVRGVLARREIRTMRDDARPGQLSVLQGSQSSQSTSKKSL